MSKLNALAGRLTYANVVATLALFVALGGASYAAIKIPKNSVGTKHIKKGAITTDKIRNGAIGSGKIKNGSLTEDDFDELPEGEPGRDGLDGLDGVDGRDGPPGPPANPEYWAFANADGSGVRGTAIAVTKKPDPGTYAVNFAGDRRTSCGLIASLDGTAPGLVAAAAGENENEDVIVRTFNQAGAPADRGFHVTARC
jgi:hypothetical protein